ncbi:MAG TPA: DUF6434 domain-containing protein [Spirochaetota bacterium]|nr:DUF6434 domain-containing protein [Spirochaetota bacterium]
MRPELNKNSNADEFLDFYWLKEELVIFCKNQDLPSCGSKDELTARIHEYLRTGKVIIPVKNKSEAEQKTGAPPALGSKIPAGYKNDEMHREFFKSVIGNHFKFNVAFMNWMKGNHGKTYQDAVLEWNRIIDEKKQGKKTEISSQFQYNQYTRDFFNANPKAKRDEAVKCWKYKKSLPGHNKYEESDLVALK